jgi:hypothetical protein
LLTPYHDERPEATDSAPPPCERCAPLAAELAHTLRALAWAREREAELLVSLREWNLAAARVLDGRDEVQP